MLEGIDLVRKRGDMGGWGRLRWKKCNAAEVELCDLESVCSSM